MSLLRAQITETRLVPLVVAPVRTMWGSLRQERLLALSGSSWRYLAILSVCYVILFGGLLVQTRLMPYVMDNNETFSSLTHASNMFKFGVAKDFGLTDEAYG